jgi:hypothetical protein
MNDADTQEEEGATMEGLEVIQMAPVDHLSSTQVTL